MALYRAYWGWAVCAGEAGAGPDGGEVRAGRRLGTRVTQNRLHPALHHRCPTQNRLFLTSPDQASTPNLHSKASHSLPHRPDPYSTSLAPARLPQPLSQSATPAGTQSPTDSPLIRVRLPAWPLRAAYQRPLRNNTCFHTPSCPAAAFARVAPHQSRLHESPYSGW